MSGELSDEEIVEEKFKEFKEEIEKRLDEAVEALKRGNYTKHTRDYHP